MIIIIKNLQIRNEHHTLMQIHKLFVESKLQLHTRYGD